MKDRLIIMNSSLSDLRSSGKDIQVSKKALTYSV